MTIGYYPDIIDLYIIQNISGAYFGTEFVLNINRGCDGYYVISLRALFGWLLLVHGGVRHSL